jgi:hypothetical protein
VGMGGIFPRRRAPQGRGDQRHFRRRRHPVPLPCRTLSVPDRHAALPRGKPGRVRAPAGPASRTPDRPATRGALPLRPAPGLRRPGLGPHSVSMRPRPRASTWASSNRCWPRSTSACNPW